MATRKAQAAAVAAKDEPARDLVVTVDQRPLEERQGSIDTVVLEAQFLPAVETEESAEECAGLLRRLAVMRRDVEEDRKRLTRPLMDVKAQLDGRYKALTGRIEEAERHVKDLLRPWLLKKQEEEERRAAEARRKAEEIAAEARRKAEQEAAETGAEVVLPVEAVVPEIRAQSASTRSADGGAGLAKRWTFEVTDPAAVPRQYLAVDEPAIRRAVQGGEREIPGVRIYQAVDVRSKA